MAEEQVATQAPDRSGLRNPLSGFEALSKSSSSTSASQGKHGIRELAKAWAWRATASYVWLSFLAVVFGQYEHVQTVSRGSIAFLTDALGRVGFQPSDATYLGIVLKISWMLVITGFSLIEVVGFALYVLGFPLGLIGFLLLGRVIKKSTGESETKDTPASKQSKARRLPLFSIAVVGLFSWFLLYGDSSSIRAVVPGAAFAGFLFSVLFYRFFRRVRPIGEDEAALLGRIEVWGLGFLEFAGKFDPTQKSEIALYRWMGGWHRRVYRRLSILVRGRRGRDRISIYILLEYALSAIVLAVAAVIFWALAIKCALAPAVLPLDAAVQLAASHFIPGLNFTQKIATPPFWVSVCTGATAWLLFVVVLAPAGSLLPARQAAHATRLARTYKAFRICSKLSARFLRWLDRKEQTLATK